MSVTPTTRLADAGTPPLSPHSMACSQKREQVAYPIEVARMMGLDIAAGLLGKGPLAGELCITVRALNYKINADRGASDADIMAAARGLEERGEKFLSHARKLRAALGAA